MSSFEKINTQDSSESFKASEVEARRLKAGMYSVAHEQEIKSVLPSGSDYAITFKDGTIVQINREDELLIRD